MNRPLPVEALTALRLARAEYEADHTKTAAWDAYEAVAAKHGLTGQEQIKLAAILDAETDVTLWRDRAVTDAEGTEYVPFSDGWSVGFHVVPPPGRGAPSWVYLTPSGDSTDGVSNVFLYHDEADTEVSAPSGDTPVCYVDVSNHPAGLT